MKKAVCLWIAICLSVSSSSYIMAETEPENLPEEVAAETAEEKALVNVIVPTTIDFTIDPFELNGRGQIFSDPLLIENKGETKVSFAVTAADIVCSDEDDFVFLDEPFDSMEEKSNKKEIYMEVVFDREETAPIIVTAREKTYPVIELDSVSNEKSVCSFSVEGSLNEYPAKEWEEGEIGLSLSYSLTEIPVSDDEQVPPEDETTEPTPPEGGTTEPTPPEGGTTEPTPPEGGGTTEPTPPEGGGTTEPTPPEGGGTTEPTPPEGGGTTEPTPPPEGGGTTEPTSPPDGDATVSTNSQTA